MAVLGAAAMGGRSAPGGGRDDAAGSRVRLAAVGSSVVDVLVICPGLGETGDAGGRAGARGRSGRLRAGGGRAAVGNSSGGGDYECGGDRDQRRGAMPL